jgi:hypothetical protein
MGMSAWNCSFVVRMQRGDWETQGGTKTTRDLSLCTSYLWSCHCPGAASTPQHGGSPGAVVMGSERGAEDTKASVRDEVTCRGHGRSQQVPSGENRDLHHL